MGLSWFGELVDDTTPWYDGNNWALSFNECFSHPHHQDIASTTSTAVKRYEPVPKLARPIYLDHKADLFIQWTVKFLCPANHTASMRVRDNYFRLCVNDTGYPVTAGTIQQHDYDGDFDMDVYTRVVSGCKLITGLASGWHNIYIGAAIQAPFVFLGVSNMIIEAEYDIT